MIKRLGELDKAKLPTKKTKHSKLNSENSMVQSTGMQTEGGEIGMLEEEEEERWESVRESRKST
jgi:hypothetical protein